MDIKEGLLLWFPNFLIKSPLSLPDKSAAGSGVNIDANKSAFNNEQLAE